MALLAEIAAAVLAVALLWSSVAKSTGARRRAFARQLPVPRPFKPALAWAVVCAELSTAVAILIPLTRRVGLTVAVGLLIIFTIYIVLSPQARECNCFGGALEFNGRHGLRFLRNGILAGSGIVALAGSSIAPPRPSVLVLSAASALVIGAASKVRTDLTALRRALESSATVTRMQASEHGGQNVNN